MKIVGWLLAGLLGINSSVVMAHGLHVDANEVAAALAATAESTDAYREKVRTLRAESERLHRLGKHHASEATMEQAATLIDKK